MANWAVTDYAIEGPKKTLQKIEKAILNPDVKERSTESWEGNVLRALSITWEERGPNGTGKYLRGFIQDTPWWDGDTLRFYAEEAWGATDFNEILEENIKDIKVFWVTEEEGMGVYETNDAEGKYFPARFFVDTCIDDNYSSDYFKTKEAAYAWLSKITNGRIVNEEDVDSFNETANSLAKDDYIAVNEFKIITK